MAQTSGQFFKNMRTVHISLAAGQVVFAVTAFALVGAGMIESIGTELDNTFLYLVGILVLSGLMGNTIIYKNKIAQAKNGSSLGKKMTGFSAALMLRYAVLEGPSFFSIIAYMLSRNTFLLLGPALILAVFISLKPSADKAIADLELSRTDADIVLDPGAPLIN